jgi:hypothetical protein
MRVALLALLGLSLIACRGSKGPGGDDDDTPDAPGGRVTIQQIQDDAMPVGTKVELEGVIVTAIDAYGSRTGDLWVQEPGGGEFSGIKVFGAPLNVVATLQVGDIVNISNAEKDEFALSSDTSGRTVTELKPVGGGQMVVVKTGTGPVPEPLPVDALAIGMLPAAERDAEWEKYEGVLIVVSNAKALTNIRTFGGGAEDQTEFRITGDARVQSALAPLPMGAAAGDCYASIVGVSDYFFNWLVLPRETAELAGNGATCAPEEEGDAACSDDIDNDGDGFIDCADFSCQSTAAACSTSTTIADVQAGNATGSVILSDVFIAAVSFNRRSIWISQSLTAAPNEGVFVFRGAGQPELSAEIVPGAKVTVSGTVTEFNDDAQGGTLTQIVTPTITLVEQATLQPVPVAGMTAAELLDPVTGAMFESVLVTLTNVEITALGNATNGFIATGRQNGTTFGLSTEILRLLATDLDCYTAITGLWTNLQAPAAGATTKPNAQGFVPATLGATGGACP